MVKLRKVVIQGLKIYDRDLVAGSGRLGKCDCHEKNAVEMLAVGVDHCIAVVAGYDSIGSEGHWGQDSYFVDKVEIDFA